MNKDPKIYLEHILESIDKIESYIKNLSEKEFMNNTEAQDAVIRRFEIIGEATKNIPDDFKEKHSDLLWRNMAGMRDVLIHNYADVDIKIVWDTAKDKIKELKKQIQEVL